MNYITGINFIYLFKQGFEVVTNYLADSDTLEKELYLPERMELSWSCLWVLQEL